MNEYYYYSDALCAEYKAGDFSLSIVLVPPIAIRDHAEDEWMEVVGMN